MKIVIFGANGKTGRLLVDQALKEGHKVIAFIRNPGSLLINHPNIKIVVGHLNETLKLRDIISGSDACISAIGGKSLTHRSIEFTNGIENLITVLKEEGVKRFIYLSSLGAGESKCLIPQPARFFLTKILLRVPLADHNKNESHILSSNLDWTIVRPAGLTDGKKTCEIKDGITKVSIKGNPRISRANVANFMLKQIMDPTYIHKCVWLYE